MSDKSWERRTLLSYGSNFRIDVNNPQTTVMVGLTITTYMVLLMKKMSANGSPA